MRLLERSALDVLYPVLISTTRRLAWLTTAGVLSVVGCARQPDTAPQASDGGVPVAKPTDEALIKAVQQAQDHSLQEVERLLGEGADPNARGADGMTALMEAASGFARGYHKLGDERPEMVRLLLERRADVHARMPDGSTALMLAAMRDYEAVVKLLLEKGADANAKRNDGSTALILAAKHGGERVRLPSRPPLVLGVAKLLLDKGADANATTAEGETALLAAAWYGHPEVVKLLLEKGANRDAALADGRTALMLADSNRHPDIVAILEESVASPSPPPRASSANGARSDSGLGITARRRR